MEINIHSPGPFALEDDLVKYHSYEDLYTGDEHRMGGRMDTVTSGES